MGCRRALRLLSMNCRATGNDMAQIAKPPSHKSGTAQYELSDVIVVSGGATSHNVVTVADGTSHKIPLRSPMHRHLCTDKAGEEANSWWTASTDARFAFFGEATTMRDDQECERRETIDELSELFALVQQMGQRLADETQGDKFAHVQLINDLLHAVRLQIDECRAINY